jgi:hypothetical protein
LGLLRIWGRVICAKSSFGTDEIGDLRDFAQAILEPLFQGSPVENIVLVHLPQTSQNDSSSIIPTFDATLIVAPNLQCTFVGILKFTIFV